jgi:hypothetical protein
MSFGGTAWSRAHPKKPSRAIKRPFEILLQLFAACQRARLWLPLPVSWIVQGLIRILRLVRAHPHAAPIGIESHGYRRIHLPPLTASFNGTKWPIQLSDKERSKWLSNDGAGRGRRRDFNE